MPVQKFLVIITFILTNHQLRAFDAVELVRDIGNSLCPYINYCHTNASREYNYTGDGWRPSCLPCSCDDDCWLLGNCCPDKEEPTEHPLILPCKMSKVKGSSNEGIPFDMTDILKQRVGANYRVIDACPLHETNKTLSQKCQDSETIHMRTLSEYVLVSDSVTGMIYQNIFCIKCHAIEQFWYWKIQTSCIEILDAGVDAETLLSMDCDIHNVVPESKAALVAKYQCFDYNLEDNFDSDCNVTAGLNHQFVTACKRSTWPYLTTTFIQSIHVYKNVFCFVCQFGIEAVRDDIYMLGKLLPMWPFSALINYVESPEGSKNLRKLTCNSGQVADPHANTCYELQCPFGKYAWYGKCEKKFSILRDACLCVILYIEVLIDHAMQQMDNDTLDHYLADFMVNILHQTLRIAKWDEMECLVEPIIARTRNDDTRNPVYNISLAIHINSLCNLYDVTENIMKRQLGVTTVNVKNETNVDINIKLNLKRTNDNAGFNTCHSKIMCHGKMRLNNDIVCPQIGLNYSDAERFSSGQKAEVSAFLAFFDSEMTPNKTTTVWVCLEKYLKTISESNGDYPSTADWTVTLFSILLVNLGVI